MPIAANPDVPSSVWTPGTYIYISTTPQTPGAIQPRRRLVLLAPMLHSGAALTQAPYNLAGGTGNPNEVVQHTQQNRVNLFYGRRSGAAQRFREAASHVPAGIDIFVAPVVEAQGTGFSGVATALLTVSGIAVGAGEISIWLCGHLVRVGVANGDTPAIISTAIRNAILSQVPDAPLVPAPVINNETIPLTYIHRGEVGNDKPIVVRIPDGLNGITISPGTITITTNSLGKGGNPSVFTLKVGSLALSVPIPVATTPTDAATMIAAAINTATFPVRATALAGVVTLLYRNDWVVHRISVASTEDVKGQVYTLADRHDSSGSIASVATVPGTPTATALGGVGTPNLSAVLSNLAKQDAFQEWASEFTDANSLQFVSQHIETYANGLNQKDQRLTFGLTTDVETAKLAPTTSSPALTNYWRYTGVLCQDFPQQAAQLASMTAAALCVTSQPFNFDGYELTSENSNVPNYTARQEVQLDPATRDVAMRGYHLTVVQGLNGRNLITRGVTTWGALDNLDWVNWSYGRMFDLLRFYLIARLNERFGGRILFVKGPPRVPNGFTLSDVEAAVYGVLAEQDGVIVDGAGNLRSRIKAELDPDDDTRIRISLAHRPPKEIHVKTGVIAGP